MAKKEDKFIPQYDNTVYPGIYVQFNDDFSKYRIKGKRDSTHTSWKTTKYKGGNMYVSLGSDWLFMSPFFSNHLVPIDNPEDPALFEA